MAVQIRRWRRQDAAQLARILNNKAIQDNLRDGIAYPYLEEHALEYLEMTLSTPEEQAYTFAIVLGDDVIGSIGVFRQENIHFRTGEMGYYIGQEYWGKGYGTQAVKLVCDYVFNNTNIVRIFAEPFSYNTGSCRILEKAGFELEGIMRKNAQKNGRMIDMKLYAKIKG